MSGRGALLPTAIYPPAVTPSASKPRTAMASGMKLLPRSRSASCRLSGGRGGSTDSAFWRFLGRFMDLCATGSVRPATASANSNASLPSAPKSCVWPMRSSSFWPQPMSSPAWPITASCAIFLNMNGAVPAAPRSLSHSSSATSTILNTLTILMDIRPATSA